MIGDLDLQLSITHSNIGYLDATLTGPDGQRIELFSEIGGSGNNFEETRFDDQAEYPINKARPPFQGTFLPMAQIKRQPSLSHYVGKNAKGIWQLVIRGTRSDRFGMLHNWRLIIKPREDILQGPSAAPLPAASPVAETQASASSAAGNPPSSAASTIALQRTAVGNSTPTPVKASTVDASPASVVQPDAVQPDVVQPDKEQLAERKRKYLEWLAQQPAEGAESGKGKPPFGEKGIKKEKNYFENKSGFEGKPGKEVPEGKRDRERTQE